MEYSYNSVGLTRLAAMKQMLKCLLVVITETPFENEDMPFMRKNPDGKDAITFQQYLDENRLRLECLHKFNAFDPKEYSERATHGKIGFSHFEVVRNSKCHSVRLRALYGSDGLLR